MLDVAGKAAFVTGGASGIRLGMVRVFAAAGMKVNTDIHMSELSRPDRYAKVWPSGTAAPRITDTRRQSRSRGAGHPPSYVCR
jgi:NAD(P)-dependent dehydrogenase (short-subunit alcohol dehydrogenase family)